MIVLKDKDTGDVIGEITEKQLQFLIDELEEEFTEDTDYYIDGATIELLEGRDADPKLIVLLREALGDRPEMEIIWSRR